MLSVGMGPFGLSIGHLLLMLAFIIALIVGALAGRKENLPISGALADIFLAALLGARIGFVVRYFEHYQDDWLGIIDIRDGGFDLVSGVVVALVFTGYLLWRSTNIRRPLGFAVAAGLMTWGSTTGVIALINNQIQGFPEVALTDLNEQPVSLESLNQGQPTVVNLWATWCPPVFAKCRYLRKPKATIPESASCLPTRANIPKPSNGFSASKTSTWNMCSATAKGALAAPPEARACQQPCSITPRGTLWTATWASYPKPAWCTALSASTPAISSHKRRRR